MLDTLVLSVTYRCPIKCRYCGAECGPDQTDELSRDEMIDLIDHVNSYGQLELVVFTGGEPLLLGDDLRSAVEHCTSLDLKSRIVTNAYWAVNPRRAREVVESYVDAGLSEINLSADDYHQEFLPVERVRFANDASNEAGLPCLIGHKVMHGCRLTIERLEEALGTSLEMFDPKKKNPDNNIVSTGYTVPVAEDMHLIPDEEILYPDNPASWVGPCSSVLQRIVITPRKELSICCGMIPRSVPEIVFGTLGEKTLEELIWEAHQSLIVNWLAFEGPLGLMRFINEKRPEIEFRERYVNTCHLCSEILTRDDCRDVLREFGGEKAMEVFLERCLYDSVRESDEIAEMMKR